MPAISAPLIQELTQYNTSERKYSFTFWELRHLCLGPGVPALRSCQASSLSHHLKGSSVLVLTGAQSCSEVQLFRKGEARIAEQVDSKAMWKKWYQVPQTAGTGKVHVENLATCLRSKAFAPKQALSIWELRFLSEGVTQLGFYHSPPCDKNLDAFPNKKTEPEFREGKACVCVSVCSQCSFWEDPGISSGLHLQFSASVDTHIICFFISLSSVS